MLVCLNIFHGVGIGPLLKKYWLLIFFSSQISATEHKVYTVTNESILMTNDHELWTFHARSMFNPETSLPFMEGNHAKENYNK